MTEDKIYFSPGDVVKIKRLDDAPFMIVKRVDMAKSKVTQDTIESKKQFNGIRCFWFTTTGELQEATFNTKDLIKL